MKNKKGLVMAFDASDDKEQGKGSFGGIFIVFNDLVNVVHVLDPIVKVSGVDAGNVCFIKHRTISDVKGIEIEADIKSYSDEEKKQFFKLQFALSKMARAYQQGQDDNEKYKYAFVIASKNLKEQIAERIQKTVPSVKKTVVI